MGRGVLCGELKVIICKSVKFILNRSLFVHYMFFVYVINYIINTEYVTFEYAKM